MKAAAATRGKATLRRMLEGSLKCKRVEERVLDVEMGKEEDEAVEGGVSISSLGGEVRMKK